MLARVRSLFLVAGLLFCLSACSTSASPTLPIPPPTALSTPPDDQGLVTVRGSGALEGALISVLNVRTEEGVIVRADDLGEYRAVIAAQAGDSLTLWQRAGTMSSGILEIIVPAR